jgi:hypothetical protein
LNIGFNTLLGYANDPPASALSLNPSTGMGLLIANRTAASGTNAEIAYVNSANITQNTQAAVLLPNDPFFVGALDNAGSAADFSADQIAYVFWGASLSASQVVLLSYRINADATALGINTF